MSSEHKQISLYDLSTKKFMNVLINLQSMPSENDVLWLENFEHVRVGYLVKKIVHNWFSSNHVAESLFEKDKTIKYTSNHGTTSILLEPLSQEDQVKYNVLCKDIWSYQTNEELSFATTE